MSLMREPDCAGRASWSPAAPGASARASRGPSSRPAPTCWFAAGPTRPRSQARPARRPGGPGWAACGERAQAVFARADVRDAAQAQPAYPHRGRPVRPARRADQQRGRRAAGRGGHRLAAVPREGHRAQPDRPAARGAGGQRGHAGAARRRVDHHDRQRQRHPPLARHRGLRRGQGRPAPPGHQPRRRVGAQGPGEQPWCPGRWRPAVPRRARTSATRLAWRRWAARCRWAGWRPRRTSRAPACSWPRRRPPT